jgi:peroxiredoxin Q/BCP
MLRPGEAAPDFRIVDETGVQRRLADFAGRTLVVWFYPKADTPG